tara:strand:- start:392 stop:1111 length:720 start_codon:yes stop_codon:yes gene_type:complete
MADRNVVGSNTFEQFRVEFNELATDVGDIASITGASGIIASATDVIEAVTTLNTSVGNELDLPDSSGVNVGRIKLGDSDDLQIYHDGSNSFISDGGTGEIRIQTNNLNIQNAAGNESMIGATEDAGVALYFNNSQKLVTNNTGVAITGNLTATGNITADGNITLGDADTDSLTISADVTSHIKPNATNTFDLGGDGKEWRNLYLSGFIEDENNVQLTFPSVSGTISTEGFSIALATALG